MEEEAINVEVGEEEVLGLEVRAPILAWAKYVLE